MQYRRFGKTEHNLSVFTLGTMRWLGLPDSAIDHLISTALDLGINHLETAPAYGEAEAQLGRTLGSRRERFFITSKLLPGTPDLEQKLHKSLKDLGTDYLDFFAWHGINLPEHLTWVQDQGMPILQRLKNQGIVHFIGFSTHGSLDLILAAIQTGLFDFVNLHYHYIQQRNAPALMAAHTHDLGVLIISPADKGGQLYQPPDRLRQLCQPWDPLHFAYQFLLSHPSIHTLSLGADHPNQIYEALVALNLDWDPTGRAIQARLDEQLRSKGECQQCYACLPCPEQIPIPEILRLRNLVGAFDLKGFAQYRYNMLGQAGHWFPGVTGNHCSDCGECLPRCPSHLDIPKLLRDTHRQLYTRPIRRLWET
ncbi:MAG: aldo/keto reductase [Thermostichales cyanobacterium HHBFW_bins_127]